MREKMVIREWKKCGKREKQKWAGRWKKIWVGRSGGRKVAGKVHDCGR